MGSRGFWQELKRRHVYRVAAAYAVVGWLLIQVATQVFPVFHLPDWIEQAVVLVILVGFPIALVLAWAFDATPQGVVATDAVTEGGAASAPLRRRSRRAGIAVGLIGVLVAAVAGGAYWHFGRTVSRAMSAKAAANAHPTNGPDGVKRTAFAGMQTRTAEPARRASDMDVANNPGNAAPDSAAGAAASGLRGDVAAQAIPAKSVAVLPFENLSTDKGNGYFADGMQDLILTKLADIGDLKVISRTSTMKYASHPDDLKIVGQQLGVATILEGSVQKAGNQVLINVQLIDAKTDNHLWAESYTRTLDNIFDVEGEVAQKVADALNAKLTQAESTRVSSVMTQNPDAFNDYLRGEHYYAMTRAGDFKVAPKAVAAYRSATEADPGFALAWARLAFMQTVLKYASIDTSEATAQQAMASAQRALALAPDLAEAHLALGYVYRIESQDLDKALAEFRIAQKALPNSAEVDAAIAYIKDIQGDEQAAAALLERAVTRDPRDPNLAFSLGKLYEALRDYDRARVAFRRMLVIAPEDPEGYSALARLAVMQHGNVSAALAELDQAPVSLQAGPQIVYTRVSLLLLKRDYPAALKAATGLQPGGRFITPGRIALLRATVNHLAGDATEARENYAQVLALARTAVHAGNAGAEIEIIYAEIGLGNQQAAAQAARHAGSIARHFGYGDMLNEVQYALAVMHAKFGDAREAVNGLDALLRLSSSGFTVSVPLLKLDPMWDPIRHDPRFQALLKQYARSVPVSTESAGPISAATTGTGDG